MNDNISSFQSLIDPIQYWASKNPYKIAFRFLSDGKTETARLTFAELNWQAQSIGNHLKSLGLQGEPVILLFPPGLEFISAFLGSLYNQNLAIPLPLPRTNKGLTFLEQIVSQTNARAILSVESVVARLQKTTGEITEVHKLPWIAIDCLPQGSQELFKDVSVDPASIAYLQYTSGSTSQPKGVMISHKNVLSNLLYIHEDFDYRPSDVCVSWLPHFHDMGLVNGILQPLLHGITCVLFPPLTFVQRPIRWLKAISDYRGTHSGGPNFAYDLCCQKISSEEKASLDLSCWDVAINGAEPISHETVCRFASTFASCGFRFKSFSGGYGLAEGTLKVSSTPRDEELVHLTLDGEQMARGVVLECHESNAKRETIVGCGSPGLETDVVIVDPYILEKSPPERIGEIWVSGPGVAGGYWRQEKESQMTFNAHLSSNGQGPFLRTGDLGFIKNGQLYICGRLKDLIIIRGQNYYPHDIERIVEDCDLALGFGRCAAFSVPIEDEECLVIVQEMKRQKYRPDFKEREGQIRQKIGERFAVVPYCIVFVKFGSIPKTSSGKLQRSVCRNTFLSGKLNVLWSGQSSSTQSLSDGRQKMIEDLTTNSNSPSNISLECRLRDVIARLTKQNPCHVAVECSLPELGIDSLKAAELQSILEEQFGLSVSFSDLLGGANIKQLASLLPVSKEHADYTQISPLQGDTWEGVLYPLSSGQKALWFLHQLDPKNASYHVSITARMGREVDISILEDVFHTLVKRHSILRTTVDNVHGQPMQMINSVKRPQLQVVDVSSFEPEDFRQKMIEERDRPFDLKTGPLFRSQLFLHPSLGATLQLTAHHIVMDLWSLTVFIDEMRTLYNGKRQGSVHTLRPVKFSYLDYVRWEKEMLTGPAGAALGSFWETQLDCDLAPLNLPTDRPRPVIQTSRGGECVFRIEEKLVGKLKSLAHAENVTLHTILLTAFYVLLYRYTGQTDLTVGTPTTGRSRPEFEKIVGYFSSPLALKADLSGNPSFGQLVSRIFSNSLAALDHQDYPFEQLVNRLQPHRDSSYPPVFQTMFVFEQIHRSDLSDLLSLVFGEEEQVCNFGELEFHPVYLEQRSSQVDLTLVMGQVQKYLRASFQFNADLFEVATVRRMATHFLQLLESVVLNPEQPIDSIPLISQEERKKILLEWNDTERRYSEHRCFHHYVEDHAQKKPNDIAIQFGDKQLTYFELNRKANQLANFLQGRGVRPEVPVGICMSRSLNMVVALLGILKAGGAYVPLDPSSPPDRLIFTLQDANVRLVLASKSVVIPPRDNQCVIDLDSHWHMIEQESDEPPHVSVSPNSTAYIMYTSGTTGRPKGVIIEHCGLYNLIQEQLRIFKIPSQSRVLQFSSLSFDASIFEFTMALCRGAILVLGTPEELLPGYELLEFLQAKNINVATLTPSILETLPYRHLPELHLLNLAGESCSQELVERWGEGRAVFNLYGPTEATVWATFFECGGVCRKPPIGRPIGNAKIFILDKALQPVPVGVPGEIYIGGVGLARGYVNLPDHTRERFINNPFQPGARLYKSGDLARYLSDGTIEFLERVDHQVKIRGIRIELGEIESILMEYPDIKEVTVLPHEGRSNAQYLIGFLVVASNNQHPFSVADLLKFLKSRLPAYMLPSRFNLVDRLPRLPSGKINRRELLEREFTPMAGHGAVSLPHNPIEESLLEIWRDLLGLSFVGVQQNFFELGGHSLLVTQVLSRIRDIYQVELSVGQFFQNPTIAGLSEGIIQARQVSSSINALVPGSHGGPMPLSYSQERIWFLHQLEDCGPAYTIPAGVWLSGPLNIKVLEKCINEIVRRHEILRTVFIDQDGRSFPKIIPSLTIKLSPKDLSHLSPSAQQNEIERIGREEGQRPFNLADAPLFRLSLLRLGESDHLVLLMMHHIISDAWSLGLFFKELGILYEVYINQQPSPLPELDIQYTDFSYWHRQWLVDSALDSQLAYWKSTLKNAPSSLDLPADHPRPPQQTFRGALELCEMPAGLSQALTAMSHAEGVTLFMLLLAGFKTLLFRYTNQEDILVGTPIANRNWSAVEGLIGTFVNTLVLRTDLSRNPTFRELLGRIKETTLGAYDHQDLPFEKLVEVLQPDRDLSRSPLFQVMFTVPNVPMPMREFADLQVKPWFVDRGAAQFDLTMSVVDTLDKKRWLAVEYNTDLFNRETIIRMVRHYTNILQEVVGNPESQLAEIFMLSSMETQQLLVAWNETVTPFPENVCIHEMFQKQAEETPDAVAVTCGVEQLTYRQLNEKANELAMCLRDQGIGPEGLVGIFMDRSLEMLISLIGVHKAGGAYLPLDPDFPQKRLLFMINDSDVTLVLTKSPLLSALKFFPGKKICLDSLPGVQSGRSRCAENRVSPKSLAYVIYTSGSTGNPKGVMISHSSVVNFLNSMRREPGLVAADVLLAVTSLSFDIAGLELFLPLMVGARVVIADQETIKDGPALAKLLLEFHVSVMQATPATWRMLIDSGWQGSSKLKILCGGEHLSVPLAKELLGRGREVWNLYGPTEATIWSTVHRVGLSDDPVPIGRPIDNTMIYILDAQCRPVPIGVPGELFIGGVGVAQGYLRRPQLNRCKFLSNEFSKNEMDRLYKTGDLARYRPDGAIEYLGRMDLQVKMRGYRIELAEIEHVLEKHANVRHAVVTARGKGGEDTRLVAYVVTSQGDGDSIKTELRNWLVEYLPSYMIPSEILVLERLPLTPNKKVDRSKLPEPHPVTSAGSTNPPVTPMEKEVAAIWSEVLGLPQVGIEQNFFEIGGHSLLATQILARLRERVGIELPLRCIFETPTIGGLSKYIETLCLASQMRQDILKPLGGEFEESFL